DLTHFASEIYTASLKRTFQRITCQGAVGPDQAALPPLGTGALTPPPAFAAPEGGWVSADESSGYESESAASCIPSPPGQSEPQPRRARTAFTPEQVGKLEKTFKRQKYVGAPERRKLAAALQLSEIQVSARPQSPRHRDRHMRRAGELWAARCSWSRCSPSRRGVFRDAEPLQLPLGFSQAPRCLSFPGRNPPH
uniref:Homeobox domain-containing protein n=1 Tax=Chelydra serpentina TaxID=8475 RepID=A0A8C3RJW0_CHESE